MPTPVSTARLCLAGEASVALDEAVAVARRRCHVQTTSLHVVSALLSLPSSSSSLLRDALSRARSAAYSPRLQFKALELCFSVALDRLPTSSSTSANAQQQPSSSAPAEPPVSNSLMAAIKRSQANQRRNPETFHLYHHQQHMQQQQAQSPSFAGVKVELQQLILSILDDPVVSRVFGEAGFRSCDIKFAILRPPPASIFRFSRPARCPPLFLCNFSSTVDEFDPVSDQSFSFPFSQNLLYPDGSEENCRRIGEVLVRKKGRNPLLVGAGATDALQYIAGVVGKERWTALPQEITGTRFFSVEKDVADFVAGVKDRTLMETRIEELGRTVASCSSVLVSVGDLKRFLDDGGGKEKEGLGYVVSELTNLVCGAAAKMWLIGSSATYETYMKFLAKFPSVDKDWDLQLLPITSVKVGSPALLPKPNRLMESFVPFGGFPPKASNPVVSSRRSQPSSSCCHDCNEKYEQEVAAVLKEHSVPVSDMHKSSLPSQLQKAAVSFGNLDMTKDDGEVLKKKLADLQKKWNDICWNLHNGNNMLETEPCQAASRSLPRIVGFPEISDKESMNQVVENMNSPEGKNEHGNVLPIADNPEKVHSVTQSLSTPILSVSESLKENTLPELDLALSKSVPLKADHLLSQSRAQSVDLSLHSSLSVSTDLTLGIVPASPCKANKPTPEMLHKPHNSGLSRCFSSKNSDMVSGTVAATSIPSSHSLPHVDSPRSSTKTSALSPSISSGVREAGIFVIENRSAKSSSLSPMFNPQNFKALYRSLIEKVGRQEEALSATSEAITRCRAGHGKRGGSCIKGNIWLSFLGPDRIAKKRVALALAELLFGSKERLISVDLGLQHGESSSYRICDRGGTSGDGEDYRGKMVVDHIAGEMNKRPSSVIFLENVNKADFLVQSSLSQAIRTGRFPDSHGREISTSNTIFVTTTSSKEGNNGTFTEERILSAQRWQMKISIESALRPLNVGQDNQIPMACRSDPRIEQGSPRPVFLNKRKLNNAGDIDKQSKTLETVKRVNYKPSNKFVDLNVPFEETITAASDADGSGDESNCVSSDSNSAVWLEEFSGFMDETILFKPFNFDALAGNILREITKCFQDVINSKCNLEIDPRAMEQMLAATWLVDGMRAFNDWSRNVLGRSFAEARERYNLSTHTTLRLVACEESFMLEHPPGILLPFTIGLN